MPILLWLLLQGTPNDACLPSDAPQIAAAQKSAETTNSHALDVALAKRSLQRLVLPTRPEIVAQGTGGNIPEPSGKGPGPGKFVRGDTYWTGSGRSAPQHEFVVDKSGNVFELYTAADPVETQNLVVCGCERPDCTYGSGCPACGVTIRNWFGPLPKGTRYRGTIKVKHPFKHVELSWAQGKCAEPCPPPPPSAPPAPPPPTPVR
jgi:hypothetical protein